MSKNKALNTSGKSLRQKLGELLTWNVNPSGMPADGKPYVVERDGMLALQFDALCLQSEMNIDDPDELVFSYTRAMMSFLLFEPAPKHIVMIGLGGGSIAKYCYRYLPQTQLTVVEINPDVIALRNEFAIPPDDTRFKVLLGDGVEYVQNHPEVFDVLLLDGFDAAGLPDDLCSQQFYDECFDALPENGILVANLWGSGGLYHAFVARIATSFGGRVIVVSADDSPNQIVLAFKDDDLKLSPSQIRRHVNELSQAHPLNSHTKSNKLIASMAATKARD